MLVRALPVAILALGAGCTRPAPSPRLDASSPVQLSVRVPAALSVSRAIDTLSVAIDPASLAATQVTTSPGTVLGVETDVFVFAQGQPLPVRERRAVARSADFDVGATAWNESKDGVPMPGTKYIIEMQLVLFETDVPPARDWDPHAGSYKALWRRTLRQAEE